MKEISFEKFLSYNKTNNTFENSRFFEEHKAVKPILIKYDSTEIRIKEILGYGSYNVVFLAGYVVNGIEKPVVYKLFLPKNASVESEVIEMEYTVQYKEFGDSILLENISLKLPAQSEYYLKKLEQYKECQKNAISLLANDELNSAIPISYAEDIFNVNKVEETNLLLASTIYEYDRLTDLEDYFQNSDDVSRKISIIESLANTINALYKSGFLLTDIKSGNFLIEEASDKKNFNLKILDWDSLVSLDSGYVDVRDSFHYSQGGIPIELKDDGDKKNIGLGTSLFMLGYMLYRALFIKQIKSGIMPRYITPGSDYSRVSFGVNDRIEEFVKDSNENYSTNYTVGFFEKFESILNKAYTNCFENRYNGNRNEGCVELFVRDLVTLREIYENKGIHPEVMLNSAIEKAKEFNKLFEVDERLFAPVSENKE